MNRFYNTTYTIFAASIILVYINQEASEVEIQPLLKLVTMAIEVLETMADECVVAGKSAKLLQKAMEKATMARHQRNSERIAGTLMSMTAATRHPHHHHQQGPPGAGPGGCNSNSMAGGGGGGGGGSNSGAPMGIGPAMTPTESDHGGGGGGGGGGGVHNSGGGAAAHHHHGHHQGHGTPGGWPDPSMGINWMHAWAPVNLLDSDMIDFELGMPFMGFDSGDVPRPG